MNEQDWLAERFEADRPHLRAVAYRMLGSVHEADDAVQEAWFRLSRTDTSGVENLASWLTTVVGRVCLDLLRSRRSRREDSLGVDVDAPVRSPVYVRVPDPIVGRPGGVHPEHEALLADSIGIALLVVLDTLAPAERLAFVLHDLFAVPFEEIAPIVGRTASATRQLASRARRRVRGVAPVPDPDLVRQRKVVDAFLAAARDGDFDALLAVLDPDVVLRADHGVSAVTMSAEIRGARAVAEGAMSFREPGRTGHPALVNGAAGVISTEHGQPVAVMGFTVTHGRIVAIDILADPERLPRLDLSAVLGG